MSDLDDRVAACERQIRKLLEDAVEGLAERDQKIKDLTLALRMIQRTAADATAEVYSVATLFKTHLETQDAVSSATLDVLSSIRGATQPDAEAADVPSDQCPPTSPS